MTINTRVAVVNLFAKNKHVVPVQLFQFPQLSDGLFLGSWLQLSTTFQPTTLPGLLLDFPGCLLSPSNKRGQCKGLRTRLVLPSLLLGETSRSSLCSQKQ